MAKTISKSAKKWIAGSALALVASLSFASSSSATVRNYSCEPFNYLWDVCTFEVFNPVTGQWEEQVEYVPIDGRYATIDP